MICLSGREVMAGEELGPSAWRQVGQSDIDRFADVTGDRSWIHVDVRRAEQEIGGPIAHGFLIASLLPAMLLELVDISGHVVNYGLDGIRFVSPVPAGASIRLRATTLPTKPHPKGRIFGFRCAVEVEGAAKPAVTADWWMLEFAQSATSAAPQIPQA